MKQPPPYGRAGSKFRLAPWIISHANRIPHTRWGELFAGTCAVTLRKTKVAWEFQNDADQWIHNFWEVMRNRRHKAELLRRVRYTGWERADFDECVATTRGERPLVSDPIERARIFLVRNVQSFNKSSRTHSISDKSSGIHKWKHMAQRIEAMSQRIQDCHIFSLDYSQALDIALINDPQTLVYSDPPYHGVEKTFYDVNKRDGFDHRAFRDRLDRCTASLIVSYEQCDPILDLYLPTDGWSIREKEVTRSLANNAKQAVELLLIRKSDWARKQPRRRRFHLPDLFAEPTVDQDANT